MGGNHGGPGEALGGSSPLACEALLVYPSEDQRNPRALWDESPQEGMLGDLELRLRRGSNLDRSSKLIF